jgi:hypothetical protein
MRNSDECPHRPENRAGDERRVREGCGPGIDQISGPMEERVREALRLTMGKLARDNASRSAVCAAMGVSMRTLESWMEEMGNRMPAHRLVQMLTPGVLPEAAAEELRDRVGEACGLVLVDKSRAALDRSPASMQLAEIVRELGGVAGRITTAMSPDSAGGATITTREALDVLDAIRRVMTEMAELEMSLENVALGKAR